MITSRFWYLLLPLFLICSPLFACSPQESSPPEKSEELLKNEQYEFTKLLQEMREDVRVMHLLSRDISSFSWADFSDIAYFENPIERTGKRVVLSTILPSEEAASPLIEDCELSLKYANQLVSYNPYEQTDSGEQMSLDQWRGQGKKLSENLDKTKYTCKLLAENSSQLFGAILGDLGASHKEAVQDKFVGKFINRTGQYLNLLSDLTKRLDEVETKVDILTNWAFAALGQTEKY